jgi:acetyl-CoA C-acetyltransferase
MGKAFIAGVGSTEFGRHPERSLLELATEAGRAAIDDAGIPPERIGAVFVGNFVSGILTGQELLGPLVAANLGLRHVEAVKVEDACASSAAGVRLATHLVGAEIHGAVLVVGVERLTGAPREVFTTSMTAAIDGDTEAASGLTFPGFWALVMRRHAHLYGTTREQVSAVSVKNRGFGVRNPLAQFREPVTPAEVLESKPIADPLLMLDCCPVTDGAAAVVVANPKLAGRHNSPAVKIAGSALVSGPPRVADYEDVTTHDGTVVAAERAYTAAGVGPEDVDVAELHDCFSIAEIVDSEDLGFFAKGEGGPAVAEGGARTVINASGGLLSKGHPTGATGCGQLYELALQLRDEHPNQVPGARIGLAHNGGGTTAAVTVHVLEACGDRPRSQRRRAPRTSEVGTGPRSQASVATDTGTVHSHTTIRVAGNAHVGEAPFVLLLVDVDGGGRRLGRYRGQEPPPIGTRVAVVETVGDVPVYGPSEEDR